jgi:serine phosphatase RsbU (regulator of sigma subunit)
MSPASLQPPRLVVHDGENSRTVAIQQIPFTIGRQGDRSLPLMNQQISRQHAAIYLDDVGYFIQDLGSRHGIQVNGEKCQSARLNSGDRVQLGTSGIVLVFLTGQDHSSTRALLGRMTAASAGTELEKLSLFLEAAQTLNSRRVLNDVLGTMIEYALRLTGAERGFVFLGDSAETLALHTGLTSNGQPLTDDSRISHSVIRDAAHSGREFLIGDVSGEGDPIDRESVVAHELRSVIAIPLRGRSSGRLLGLLYLDSSLRTSTLNRVSRDILTAIASEAANLLENARVVEAERAAELMRNELSIAASIQQNIITRELPVFPYATISARIMQCTEVGGDFYDVIPVPESAGGGFVAIVADVSGKGMPAALLAAIVHGMMYAQVMGGTPLAEAFSSVNTFLYSRISGQKYVTMLALHYKTNGEVELVNGGHIPPYLVPSNGTAQPVSDCDLPVGLFVDATFHPIALRVPQGSRLVLLSDGITESENSAGEQFIGADLIGQFSLSDPIHAVFTALQRFTGGAAAVDDSTIVVIDRIN